MLDLNPGTGSSNPFPSSKESANFQSLSGGRIGIRGIGELRSEGFRAISGQVAYVGTYTFPGTAPGGTHQSQAKGIYVFRMNPSNGGLTLLQVADIPNPATAWCQADPWDGAKLGSHRAAI